ncbi:unnamed protein product [Symbiodinium sp. KB8]|nr:unnamed protein product [Symbiodinium sp. KB8]
MLSKYASGECRQEETRSKSQDVAATLEFCSVLTGDVAGFARGTLTASLQSCPDTPAPTTFEDAKASGLPLYHKASSSVTPEVEEDIHRLLREERETQEAKTARCSPNTAASRIASAAHATVGQVERVASKVQREEEQFVQREKRARQRGVSPPSAKRARC